MGLDSVELIMKIEDTFGIRISDAQAQRCATVQDLHDAVMDRLETDGVDPRFFRCHVCEYNLRGLTCNKCPECGTVFLPSDEMKSEAVMRHLINIIATIVQKHPDEIRPEHRLIKDLKIG